MIMEFFGNMNGISMNFYGIDECDFDGIRDYYTITNNI